MNKPLRSLICLALGWLAGAITYFLTNRSLTAVFICFTTAFLATFLALRVWKN